MTATVDDTENAISAPVEPPTTGVAEFARQARLLGQPAIDVRDDWVLFNLDVPDGSHAGQQIRIAAQVPRDFPDNPPPGPHVSPAITHPGGAVHRSPLGANWLYWSRPAQGWAKDRTVKAWVRHVRSLFAQT